MNRRSFLSKSALTVGAAGAAAGVGAAQADSGALESRVAFDGRTQAGVTTPPQAHATVLALSAVAPDRGALATALQALSYRARALCDGGPYEQGRRDEVPLDSGTLGPVLEPDGLTVTIGFGASLFDDRYGLTRPAGLERMPNFPDDQLDPARSHGDAVVQICAGHRDTVVHTVRELLRAVRGSFELRWMEDGFLSAARGPSEKSSPRNLFAFRDGTANPGTADMTNLVYNGDGSTSMVVRIIRMHVEFWDRVGLLEQENMIGRHRDSGAPLGGADEFQDPRYDLDPDGRRIPLDAHIRMANPRTPDTANQVLLRRPYNYQRGFDTAGTLDQGMLFVAFNQDTRRQFAAVQERLAGEPMTDYITVVGGGYFVVPPGTGGPFGWIGETLVS